jgi:hypothetical protein
LHRRSEPTRPNSPEPDHQQKPRSPHRLRCDPVMEGLIPLLYKAIKDRRSYAAGGGRSYRSGGALPSSAPVDLDDPEQRRRWLQQELRSPVHVGHTHTARAAAAAEGSPLHRRNLSLEELAGEVGLSPDRRLRVPLPKARSVRAFACIGAA